MFRFAGCAGGTSSTAGFTNFFAGAIRTPTPTRTHPNSDSGVHRYPGCRGNRTSRKRTARQARAASENAAAASKNAASAQPRPRKLPRGGYRVEAGGERREPVEGKRADQRRRESRDQSRSPARPALPRPPSGRATPSATPPSPPQEGECRDVDADTPTLSPSGNGIFRVRPGKKIRREAAKLIQAVEKSKSESTAKICDADDSQRDILAQRLLQEAKKSLAEHDSVAAMSLATKASTLLEPLPKLADSSIPSAP